MRLGHYYPWLEVDAGVPNDTRSFVWALARKGVASIAYTRKGPESIEAPGCQAAYLPGGRFRSSVASFRALRDFLNRDRQAIDALVLYGGFTPENAVASHIAKRLSIPTIVSLDGTVSPNAFVSGRTAIKWTYWHGFEKRILRRAAGIRVLSEFERASLRDLNIATPMFIAREGVPETQPHPCATPRQQRASPVTLLFMGRIDVYQKGLDLLLEGVARSIRGTDVPHRLLIVGPEVDAANTRRFHHKVEECGLVVGRDVHIRPAVRGEQKWATMREADIFIHPSRFDGIPKVLREALASGLPVIVTPETNSSDLVVTYDAGWAVEGEPGSISRGIISAIESSQDLHAMKSIAALRLADNELTWDAAADAFSAHVSRLLRLPT